MDAITMLMQEHRRIEAVLGSLETFASRLEDGADPAPLREFVTFFRGYVDKIHHGKEEEILFDVLVRRGMSREAGPVAVMLYDHDQGRELVGALERGSAELTLSADDRSALARAARRYASLLRHHIYKEDTVLFQMASSVLSEADLDKLDNDFDAIGSDADGEFARLSDSLQSRFPPSSEPPEGSEPAGDGCDLHCTLAGCAIRNPWE